MAGVADVNSRSYLGKRRGWLVLALLSVLHTWTASVTKARMDASDSGPLYAVGLIPNHEVHHCSTLSFQLQSPRPGAATFSNMLDHGYPLPTGSRSFTSDGAFNYTPATNSRFDFRVPSAVAGKPAHVQSVTIAPIPSLQPENDIVQRTTGIANWLISRGPEIAEQYHVAVEAFEDESQVEVF